MKKLFYVCMIALVAFAACEKNENESPDLVDQIVGDTIITEIVEPYHHYMVLQSDNYADFGTLKTVDYTMPSEYFPWEKVSSNTFIVVAWGETKMKHEIHALRPGEIDMTIYSETESGSDEYMEGYSATFEILE